MKSKDDTMLEEAYSNILLKEEEENTHTLSTISSPLKQSLLDSLEEYLKAGEHQDGEGFYGHYNTAGDLAEDFARHLKTSVNAKDDSSNEMAVNAKDDSSNEMDEMVKKAIEHNKLRKGLSDHGHHGW